MAAQVPMQKIPTGNDEAIYAFYRKSGNQFVYVVVNLTGKQQEYNIDPARLRNISGQQATELFSGKKYTAVPSGKSVLKPWESRVYF